MANLIYPLYKQSLIDADTNVDLNNGNVKCSLVSADYTYNSADQFFDDLTGVVASSGNLTGKSITNGVFDCADFTFSSVSGAQVTQLVVWIDTGTASTSRLVARLDTGWTGLPVTPNGGDINITVHSSGLFAL